MILTPACVALCVPYFGGKDHEHLQCIDAARGLGHSLVQLNGHPYIDQARCLLAERALGAGAEVMVFIDHDIVFKAQDILPMAQEAHDRRAVVAGLYLTRKIGGTPVVSLDPAPEELRCFSEGGLYPCSQLPGGFTAIPRQVLDTIPVPAALLGDGVTSVRTWFLNDPFEFERDGKRIALWLGEDSRFSHRARAAGIPLFVDTRPRLFHKGAHKFALEDGHLHAPVGDSLTIRVKNVTQQIAPTEALKS